MLTLSQGIRWFVATQPADFRKSFDGLSLLVQQWFGRSPLQGDAFIFMNRRANQIRILAWDGDGLCLFMKRLEKGTFRRLQPKEDQSPLELTRLELAMILEGVDVQGLQKRRRYPGLNAPPKNA